MKTTISIAILALAATVPTLATAQTVPPEAGAYVGAALGQSKAKDACDGLGGVGFVGNCDEKDDAWKVFGGYQFNRHWGLELGYTDLGESSAGGTVAGVPANASAEAKGVELTVVGTVPLGERFSLFGKVGAFRWDVDSRATVGAATAAADDTGTNFTYGVGLSFHINRNVSIRAEWQRYNDVGDNASTGRSDVNMISAGAVFKF